MGLKMAYKVETCRWW